MKPLDSLVKGSMKGLFFLCIIVLFVSLAFAAEPEYTNSIGMEFVLVPAGSFVMGTPTPDIGQCPQDDPFTSVNEYLECADRLISSVEQDETPAHEVNITKAFYIGKYEVTQEEWYKVMGNNPAHFQSDRVGESSRRYPVERVSRLDVKEFIKKLNAREGGHRYRLPTEAEWECAAKGGQNHIYSGSNNAGDVAWYTANSGGRTHKVGTKKPNGYGIYDMSGNVWEWVEDNYGETAYGSHLPDDPIHTSSSFDYVNRGGSWGSYSGNLRIAYRNFYPHDLRSIILGFRLVRTVD